MISNGIYFSRNALNYNFHNNNRFLIVITWLDYKRIMLPKLFIIVLDYCLRSAINGREEHREFTINPRRSRGVGPLMVTDLDFADDIALVSDTACQAQENFDRVEDAALRVGLHMNAKKTQCMVFNHQDDVTIKTSTGAILEVVEDLKYLGSWTQSSSKDISIRKTQAWGRATNSIRSGNII